MSFEKGLSDYLLGKAELDEVIYKLHSERLGVIPNARAFQHSSEFLNSPRMSEFLQALEREVPRRIVIFDMPPLLASDDVLAFAPQFDSLLLVVSEGKSGRAMLRGAKEVLTEMNLLGVVLNRSKERTRAPITDTGSPELAEMAFQGRPRPRSNASLGLGHVGAASLACLAREGYRTSTSIHRSST
jgi:Mrp family chromosome partitioning ATPase